MVQKKVLRAFNSGEITPDLFGRDDVQKVNSGLKVCDNMLLTIQGAAYYRGGMSHSAQTKNNSRVLLLDFTYNDNDCYTVEFGNRYARFYRNQHLLVDVNENPIEVETPYLLADLWDANGLPALSKAQSADVVYLFNTTQKYPVQRLERLADGRFSLQEVDYGEDGGFEDINTDHDSRVYVSAQTGNDVVITADKAIFKQGHIGGIFYVEPINFNNILQWSEGRTVSANDRIISNYRTYKAAAEGTTGHTTPKHYEGTATDGKVNWIYEDCGYGIGEIKSISNDGTSCVVKTLKAFPWACVGVDRKTWKWKFGSWCEEYGYPSCGCFHRERFCMLRGNRGWFSWTDDFENFSEKDFGAITYETGFSFNISSGITVGAAQWTESGKDLLIGTDVDTVAIGESNTNDLFYVSNCRSFEQTRDACSRIQPVRVGQRFVFADITGKSINTLTYDANSYQYDSDSLQTYAKHICVEGITNIVRIREPFDIIYCLKANGALSCCLYNPNQEGLAWFRIKTDGEIVSISRDSTNLALCVKRKVIINEVESDYYSVEFLQNPFQGYFSKTLADFNTEQAYRQYCKNALLEVQKEAIYLDASNIYTSDVAFRTINVGLDHLAGRTVSIVSEGGIEPEQEVRLVNGQWTVTLQQDSKIALIGLPYKGVLVPLPMESDGETSARARVKRINRIGFRVYNSMGGQYGETMDSLKDLLSRSGGDTLDDPIPLYSGDAELSVFNGSYREAEQLIFVQPYPLPFTLQAIVYEYEIY
ncbi:MAG: hypothetical protein IJ545_04700 [Alphaproteobacteria bacterium]|nr:hypothetical protein [Alphaproteobacteria bacterium]